MAYESLLASLKRHRRALHQVPEIGFDLPKTYRYVYNELKQLGYDPKPIAQSGLYVIKKGFGKETIAFRADMDALRVFEQTDVDFRSRHQGFMHACGHDGHMAILLAFAEHIAPISSLSQNILLLFQPAEEGPGGAKLILDTGLFETHHVTHVFGLHLYPNLEKGIIGLVDGPMMARNGEFSVTVYGKSAHGAQPHLASDSVLIAAQLIVQYQSIISRLVNPLMPAVISVGTISGGEARNIIAKEVHLEGTIRTFDDGVYHAIKQAFARLHEGMEKIHDVQITCDIKDYYPPVINHSELFHHAQSILETSAYQLIEPMMLSEDFSYYQHHAKGLFVMLGSKDEEKGFIHPLHSCYFNFDESILLKGVEWFDRLCRFYHVYE